MDPKEYAKKLYSMKLFETAVLDYNQYIRVPGGWVIIVGTRDPLFIPFNNEFQDV